MALSPQLPRWNAVVVPERPSLSLIVPLAGLMGKMDGIPNRPGTTNTVLLIVTLTELRHPTDAYVAPVAVQLNAHLRSAVSCS